MKAIPSFVKRNSLVVFAVLAYLLSWWPVLVTGGDVLIAHGPLFAALLVVGISEGKVGLKAWWSRMVWRPARSGRAWRWYAVAAAIPVVIALTAAGLNLLLGAQLPAQIDWTIPFKILPIMLLLSGMWEEPGWTGFALPRLFERFGPSVAGTVAATLIMVVIRTGWHLPLMISGSIYWSDIVFIIAFQIVFIWLFNRTGGTVLAVLLSHLLSNVFSGGFVGQWFTGADGVQQAWLRTGLWCLLALGLLLLAGLRLGRKPAAQVQVAPVGQPLAAQ